MARNDAILKSCRCANAAPDAWGPWFVVQLEGQGWTTVVNPSFPSGDRDAVVGERRTGDYLFDLYELSPQHLSSLESEYGHGGTGESAYETLVR
jgi:hypothetical protein